MQITTEQAIQMQNSYISYCAAKKAGEKAIWEFVEKEKPKFHVTVFLAPLIFGPPIHKVTTIKHINYSNDVFYSLWNGTYAEVPPTSFPAYVRSPLQRFFSPVLANSLIPRLTCEISPKRILKL